MSDMLKPAHCAMLFTTFGNTYHVQVYNQITNIPVLTLDSTGILPGQFESSIIKFLGICNILGFLKNFRK